MGAEGTRRTKSANKRKPRTGDSKGDASLDSQHQPGVPSTPRLAVDTVIKPHPHLPETCTACERLPTFSPLGAVAADGTW